MRFLRITIIMFFSLSFTEQLLAMEIPSLDYWELVHEADDSITVVNPSFKINNVRHAIFAGSKGSRLGFCKFIGKNEVVNYRTPGGDTRVVVFNDQGQIEKRAGKIYSLKSRYVLIKINCK